MIHPALVYPSVVVAVASILAVLVVLVSPVIASASPARALRIVALGSLIAGVGGPLALVSGRSYYTTAPLGAELVMVYGSLGILCVVAIGVTFSVGAIFQIREESGSRWRS